MSIIRNFCLTLNNYTTAEAQNLINFCKKYASYWVIGWEKGEQGTPHLQGYVELKKRIRFNSLKRKLPRCHIEKRRGTASQAATYCKKDGEYMEDGEMSQQGKRNDLDTFVKDVRSGHRNYKLIDNHPNIMCRYHRFADTIRYAECERLSIERHNIPVEVHVRWGKPGTGKSRYCWENEPELYRVDLSDAKKLWMDGYYGQETVLLDDFNGQIPYELLLNLLDRYKMQSQVKGSYTYKAWTKVYITSNHHPRNWYPHIQDITALIRRFKSVTEVS